MTDQELHPMAEWIAKFDEQNIRAGDQIEGRVLQVDDRDVFLDIGFKSEGAVPLSEFKVAPEVGSTVTVVIKKLPAGATEQVILSKREAEERVSWEYLQDAFEKSVPLYGFIADSVSKGYLVDVNWNSSLGAESDNTVGKPVFMPMSQMGKFDGKKKNLTGTEIAFRILELNPKTKSAVVSRKVLQDEYNEKVWDQFISQCKEGDEVKASVQKIVNFGVFLDVGGVIGLLHSSDISWKRLRSFSKMFTFGEEIVVKVLQIDSETHRLSLGIKQLTEDPWKVAERDLQVGQSVRGIIRSVLHYGAFLEIEKYDGVEGLIHRSELSWTKKQIAPKDVVKVGQEVEAQILEIDLTKKRIALGLKQVLPNPWDNIDDIIKVGDSKEGTISSITKFGAFVQITPEIDGLVHISDMSWDENVKNPKQVVKKGDKVQFKILEINKPERRISCGLKQLTENPYDVLRKKYPRGSLVDGVITKITSVGLFVKIEDKFEGLVHLSNIRQERTNTIEEVKDDFKAGQPIKVVVLKVTPAQKRISLSIKDYQIAKEKEVIQPYLSDGKPGSHNPFAGLLKKTD